MRSAKVLAITLAVPFFALSVVADEAVESPLVAAARRANRLNKKPAVVITNETLARSGGHLTTTSSPQTVNVPPAQAPKAAAAATPAPATPAAPATPQTAAARPAPTPREESDFTEVPVAVGLNTPSLAPRYSQNSTTPRFVEPTVHATTGSASSTTPTYSQNMSTPAATNQPVAPAVVSPAGTPPKQ